MLIQLGQENLTLKQVQKTFFKEAKVEKDGPATKSPQAGYQPRVWVYLNSLVVEMESYVFKTLRDKSSDGTLPDNTWMPQLPKEFLIDP